MSNLNEEVSIRLVGKITLLFPQLEQNLSLQLEMKKTIDETLYDYEVQSKCTDLVASDIEEKAQIYLACKKLEGASKKTLNNYRLFLEKLDRYFTKPCSTISTMDLRMFLAIMGKGKKATTIILEGYKAENLEKLRQACNTEREKVLFELLDSTACRISELRNIHLEDINWQEQSIKVLGKGRKERIVYFSTKAKLNMQSYLENRQGENTALFISEKAPHQQIGIRALQLMIKKIKDRTNVKEKVHAHKFRRTQATHLLNSGMTIQGVQKILGHTSPETTQIYAQISQENLKNEFKRLVV